jgi:dUTP pyrophosphatase
MYARFSKTRAVKSPVRANPNDAIDLFIPDNQTYVIEPGRNYVIPTGIKMEVPHGMALMVFNKSGTASKLSLVKGAELIDHGYSGEIFIDLHNIGVDAQTLVAGQKFAQLHFVPVYCPVLMEVDESALYSDILVSSGRGEGSRGSTGT